MDFDLFWKQYPRKIAKANARIMWGRMTEEEHRLALDAIPNHVRLWTAENRQQSCIPHAATWLNPVLGRRWEDEIELPEKKETTIKVAWWSTEATMLEKGRELGTQPRPGEDWGHFKSRLVSMMQRVA